MEREVQSSLRHEHLLSHSHLILFTIWSPHQHTSHALADGGSKGTGVGASSRKAASFLEFKNFAGDSDCLKYRGSGVGLDRGEPS